MRTKRSQELAFKVCDYYDKIAHGSRKLTFKHFKKEGVPRSTLHGIITKYEETGTATYAKIKGRPRRVMTPQIIKEVTRAYQIEPSVSIRTLARRLNIPPSTLQNIKIKVAKLNVQKYELAQAQIVNSANNDSNLGSPESCQDSPDCPMSNYIEVNCTICCQNVDNCVNAQDISTTSVISHTICKLFGIQDDFESLALASTYCPNCSRLILKIQKIWQDLDEAKLQLEEIIIKNTVGAAGNTILVQNPTEIARNEIIKRIKPCPETAVKSEDNRKDLNEVLNNDPPADWNLYDDDQDNYIENAEETPEEHSNLGLAHNGTGEFYFSLKTPVLKLTKLPQSLVDQLTLKNVHHKVIQNGINLHLKKDQENRIINKSTKSSKDNFISSKKERSHLCHLCSQTFTYPFHLRKHLKSHSRKNIMCPMADCLKAFESNDDLQDHLNIHNDTKVHKCPEDQCDSLYYTKKQLATHLTLHEKLKGKFECSLCPCSFGFAKNLLSHKKSVHNYTESTELMCEICAKVFPSKKSYSKHKYNAHKNRRKHNDEKKQCPVCRCWFRDALKFERHKKIHSQLALTDHIFSRIEMKAQESAP